MEEKKNFECNNFAFFFASPIIFGLRDDRLLLSLKPYLFIQRGKILPSADLASLAASIASRCEFDAGSNTENYSLDPGSFIFRLSKV